MSKEKSKKFMYSKSKASNNLIMTFIFGAMAAFQIFNFINEKNPVILLTMLFCGITAILCYSIYSKNSNTVLVEIFSDKIVIKDKTHNFEDIINIENRYKKILVFDIKSENKKNDTCIFILNDLSSEDSKSFIEELKVTFPEKTKEL